MGAQLKPCKQVSNVQMDKTRNEPQKNKFKLSNQDNNNKLKFCSSTGCMPIQSNNDHYVKFMQNRPKFNHEIKNNQVLNVSSDTLNPKIRHSRVELGPKKRKSGINGDTIRQREALGRMLAEKLGLNPSKDVPLTQQQRQNKQRLSEIVYKICINNQQRLIDIIDQIQNSFRGSQTKSESSNPHEAKLQKFLDSVSKTELDFLDMLYHNDEELYQSGIPKLRFKRNISQNIVDIKQLMMEQKQFAGSAHLSYQRFKTQGLQMIRTQKVCFFVLAGGKSSRFIISSSQNQNSSYQTSNPQSLRESLKINIDKTSSENSKDFQPLNIPSQRSMVELIIHRLIALGELLNCHITMYLGISPDKINNLKDVFQNIVIDQKRITIYPFAQKVLGALDFQGNLVVQDHGEASLWSVGTGDLWNIMRGDKELSFPSANELIEQGFEYVQVCGTSNVLEKCFDCFSLGLASQYDLDWTTKIAQSYSKRHSKSFRNLQSSEIQNVQPKIFINNQEQIYVCDPQQIDNYPQDCRYTFMNNSLFKLEYLVNALQSAQLQKLWPRKKVHLTNNIPPFSKYRKVYSYEKDYTDIFRLATVKPPPPFDNCSGMSGLSRVQSIATKWRLILCDQADYYPLIYKNGLHSDIEYASKALTDLHRTYLGLEKCLGRIEIDPYISLQGERLQQLKKQLKDQTLNQEDWIFIQKN